MKKLSLCMIVKNEEDILEQCLDSISSVVDEIIITDTGSSDKTVEIAQKYTDKIRHFQWIDDFSAARNFCDKHAKYDYVLTWDADFVLSEESLRIILDLKENDFDNLDLVYGKFIIEVSPEGQPVKVLDRNVIYNKHKFHWESPIHNKLTPNSDIKSVKSRHFEGIKFTHYKDPIKKAYRYDQTRKILESELKKNPNNSRLEFFYVEALIFDKKYEKALDLLYKFVEKYLIKEPEQVIAACEKIMFCNITLGNFIENLEYIKQFEERFKLSPKYLLTLSDSYAAVDNKSSVEYYLGYEKLVNSPLISKAALTDRERFFSHYKYMLGNIYLDLGQLETAKRYLKEFIKTTTSLERRRIVETILKSL